MSVAGATMTQEEMELVSREIISAGLFHMATFVNTPGADTEIILKILASVVKDIAKVIPEKKVDPNAGLQVFNITFINGGVQAHTVDAPLDLEMVEVVRAELDALGMHPTDSMLAAAYINADLEGLIDG